MKIPDLNNRRARVLFDKEIRTLSDLANSDLFTIEKILNDSICFDLKQRESETKWEAEQRNKLRYLSITGKPGNTLLNPLIPSIISVCHFIFPPSSGITVRDAAKELIESAQQILELEMGVENIVWSNRSSQSQRSQKKIATTGTTLRIQTDAADRDRIRPKQTSNQMKRKRKLDEDDSDSSVSNKYSQRSGKKFRSSPSDSESDVDSDSELLTNEFAKSNLNENDQSELIEKLLDHKVFNEINKVNVFSRLEFFQLFGDIIKNTAVISVSVGVNQLLKRAPVIGLSSLVKQQNSDDDDIDSYNCTFDEDKYIAGISLCFRDIDSESDTTVCYLNLQNESSDDPNITFDMKIKFLEELFHIGNITLVMYDAKEQLKVLLKCFPQLRTFCTQLRDPLVANWLLHPDVYGNLLTMVSMAAYISDKASLIRSLPFR